MVFMLSVALFTVPHGSVLQNHISLIVTGVHLYIKKIVVLLGVQFCDFFTGACLVEINKSSATLE